MENKKHNTDIFEMVNNHERQQAIQKKYSEKRRRENLKICNWSIVAGFISLIFGLLGVTGALIIWISAPLCLTSGVICSFMAGRWIENAKCLGWN